MEHRPSKQHGGQPGSAHYILQPMLRSIWARPKNTFHKFNAYSPDKNWAANCTKYTTRFYQTTAFFVVRTHTTTTTSSQSSLQKAAVFWLVENISLPPTLEGLDAWLIQSLGADTPRAHGLCPRKWLVHTKSPRKWFTFVRSTVPLRQQDCHNVSRGI